MIELLEKKKLAAKLDQRRKDEHERRNKKKWEKPWSESKKIRPVREKSEKKPNMLDYEPNVKSHEGLV